MKEIPMLFSTPMVLAISANTKTQTRRMDDGKTLNVGDRIWVRETIAILENPESLVLAWIYRSDFIDKILPPTFVKWTPSIFMKKYYARTWLEVIDFRVERLHCITDADCVNEGIENTELGWRNYLKKEPDFGFVSPRDSFESLWKSINGFDSWDSNPMVKRIEFKKLSHD